MSRRLSAGQFRWERSTKAVEAPDLVTAGALPRGYVYEIDVRVAWDTRRQIEVKTYRMMSTPPGTTLVTTTTTTPAATSTSSTTPKGPTQK